MSAVATWQLLAVSGQQKPFTLPSCQILPEKNCMSTGAIGSGQRSPWSKHLDENINLWMKSFVTCPKRSPRFSMSILLSASATLPKCITSTSRVSKTTGQLILANTTWEDKSWSRLESVKSTCMLFATSSPWGPVFLAASTSSLFERDSKIYFRKTSVLPPVQVVREKRLRKFPEEKLQGSGNNCSVSASVKSSPLILGKKGILGICWSIFTWLSSARIFWILLTSPGTL